MDKIKKNKWYWQKIKYLFVEIVFIIYICQIIVKHFNIHAMKRILFLLAMLPIFVFTACSSDDEPITTSYTITWDMSEHELVTTDIIAFEYSADGDKIANNKMENCKNGTRKSFKANEKAEKVKIYITMNSKSSWVQNVFYLEKGKNLDIVISGDVLIGSKEP